MFDPLSPPGRTQPNRLALPPRIILVYFFSVSASLLWIAGIFLAPYLKSRASPWHAFFYLVFSSVCHQVPNRCFFLYGHPLAVCTRCLGIYSGGFLGVLLYPVFRGFRRLELPSTKLFFFLSAPIFVDTLANFVHWWNTPPLARFFTGFIWGPILPFYFITGMASLFLKREKNCFPNFS